IDGFFRHYKELGVDFIRMDFLSWYEDGRDRAMGTVGRGYGREAYARALAYIAQSAKKYGIFTSLVMPHLNNDAEVEARYGNMVRIVADTGNGGWQHTSAQEKGRSYTSWPNCMNQFDGFVYWSHITGRNKVILDGDFLRLNRYSTDAERQTAVSLQLMAGGPVAVADQPATIGGAMPFYTNDELLQLRRDGFVGQPLSNQLADSNNEIWYGTLSNGNYVVGLFNRSDQAQTVSVALSQLGISGNMQVRDLWRHADEGTAGTLSATIPAHGCKIVLLTK
ncbi:MAG: glucan 1,6-alpha-isomaltosidase, partial [Prevotella sp.]|nr:glucan 1,6-alpha-isomaltosidase [Prevotella sp.]